MMYVYPDSGTAFLLELVCDFCVGNVAWCLASNLQIGERDLEANGASEIAKICE